MPPRDIMKGKNENGNFARRCICANKSKDLQKARRRAYIKGGAGYPAFIVRRKHDRVIC